MIVLQCPPMPDQKPEPIPYATPAPRGGWRGWLSRRAATSGQRMIGFAVMALVGLQTLSTSQPYWIGWIGLWMFWIATALFAMEFLLSFFQ